MERKVGKTAKNHLILEEIFITLAIDFEARKLGEKITASARKRFATALAILLEGNEQTFIHQVFVGHISTGASSTKAFKAVVYLFVKL